MIQKIKKKFNNLNHDLKVMIVSGITTVLISVGTLFNVTNKLIHYNISQILSAHYMTLQQKTVWIFHTMAFSPVYEFITIALLILSGTIFIISLIRYFKKIDQSRNKNDLKTI